MSNPRITKKKHSRYQADFLIECTQSPEWIEKLKTLTEEGRLDTALDGFPDDFFAMYPETTSMALHYGIEKITYSDVPRQASRRWPSEEGAHYFLCYPMDFPQAALYMSVDLH